MSMRKNLNMCIWNKDTFHGEDKNRLPTNMTLCLDYSDENPVEHTSNSTTPETISG